MQLDHLGIVVRSIEEGIRQWTEVFGFRQMTTPIVNTRQQVWVVFMSRNGDLPVKLISPVDDESPIAAFARRGGGLHHTCFRCADLETEIERLKEQGMRVLTAPQPGEAFGGEDIAFLYAPGGLNVELIATDTRAGLLPVD